MTYIHTNKSLLVGTETSFGTGGTANRDVGLILTDVSTNVSKELIESWAISSLTLQHLNAGVQEGKLSISGEFQRGKLLEYVFGAVAHTNTGSDTTHTYTVGNNSALFYSGLIGSTVTSAAFTGMLADSCEISSAINGHVLASFEFRGKSPTIGTTSTAHVQSALPVFPHSMVNITVAGLTPVLVQEASLIITKENRLSDSLGSVDHVFGATTQFKVEWKCKVGLTSNQYHSLGKSAEAAGNFVFDAHNGVTLGSGRRALTITCSGKTSEVNELVSVGELVYVEISGTGSLTTATSVDNITSANW